REGAALPRLPQRAGPRGRPRPARVDAGGPPAAVYRRLTPRNLVNLSAVAKGYGARSVLRDVSLGVAAGDRTGVVGRNGDGKSTLLRLIAGVEEPDAGTVVRTGGVSLGLLGQGDDLREDVTVREELVGGLSDHEWRADPAFRDVLAGLLGGVELRR